MKRVLLVESNDVHFAVYVARIRGLVAGSQVLFDQAKTPTEAMEKATAGYDLIVWLHYELGVVYAIKAVRTAGFTGPMIAASSIDHFRDAMMAAGCTIDIGSDNKSAQLPPKILESLGL